MPADPPVDPVEDRLTILVVEDDPVYAEFVATTLRAVGHQVEHVSTATDAGDHVRTRLPDVVMLDLVLPDATGYDIAREIRGALTPSSVIILLTADLYPQRDLAEAVGIDMVLTKPVEPRLVTGMIDLVRRRRRLKLRRSPSP